MLDTDMARVSENGQKYSLWDLLPTADGPVGKRMDDRELHQLLQAAIEQLPPQQQAVVRLKYWDGLTHDEVGARLGLSAATVCRRLETAREKLHSELAEYVLSA